MNSLWNSLESLGVPGVLVFVGLILAPAPFFETYFGFRPREESRKSAGILGFVLIICGGGLLASERIRAGQSPKASPWAENWHHRSRYASGEEVSGTLTFSFRWKDWISGKFSNDNRSATEGGFLLGEVRGTNDNVVVGRWVNHFGQSGGFRFERSTTEPTSFSGHYSMGLAAPLPESGNYWNGKLAAATNKPKKYFNELTFGHRVESSCRRLGRRGINLRAQRLDRAAIELAERSETESDLTLIAWLDNGTPLMILETQDGWHTVVARQVDALLLGFISAECAKEPTAAAAAEAEYAQRRAVEPLARASGSAVAQPGTLSGHHGFERRVCTRWRALS